MIKNDIWIKEKALAGMIVPFQPKLIRKVTNEDLVSDRRVISYGLSSYGYDIRLSPKDFRIFRHIPGSVVDPKNFNPKNLEPAELHEDESGEFFILPAHSYGLGVALEQLKIPEDVTAIALNKSTYVRCGVLLPTTVLEAGWPGYLTLEFSNSSCADCRIYCEGIAQLLFFEGDPCDVSYLSREGKYMHQKLEVTLARV